MPNIPQKWKKSIKNRHNKQKNQISLHKTTLVKFWALSPQIPGAAPFTRSYAGHVATRYGAGPFSYGANPGPVVDS
jgi:hypothetical protein